MECYVANKIIYILGKYMVCETVNPQSIILS
jgi:hypothetical protein